ncbi:MAG TPA: 2-C-methyl-D-erythritol 2,4-cyclodiphosphate synthase [Thermotogales bacterium]|nr:2-C-methyl-D-erythritol 2,4-cyclodiphosphate synthase [Thermotogales bacterium]
MMRVGIGYDVHRLVKSSGNGDGKKLVIGGVEIRECDFYPLAHSDGDVLIHAIIDAIFGAISFGNIGLHFPEIDEYEGVSSLELLKRTKEKLDSKGFRVVNVDTVVILEKPRIAQYVDNMRMKISEVLDIPIEAVNIKPKRNEGLGFEGKGEGIVALAVVTVEENGKK